MSTAMRRKIRLVTVNARRYWSSACFLKNFQKADRVFFSSDFLSFFRN